MFDIEYGIKLNKLREIGKYVTECFDLLKVEPGMSLKDVESQVIIYQLKHKLQNAQFGYLNESGKPFPGYCCVSLNEVMCHGISDDTILSDGDIISIDISLIKDGYYGDSCRTYTIGKVSTKTKHFVECAREATRRGVGQALQGKTLKDIGQAIEEYIHGQKLTISKDFVGHGIGNQLHEWPCVFHWLDKTNKMLDTPLYPGLCLCIEPIICQGRSKFKQSKDGWTISTKDKMLAAQFETQVFITHNGQEIIAK